MQFELQSGCYILTQHPATEQVRTQTFHVRLTHIIMDEIDKELVVELRRMNLVRILIVLLLV